MRDCAKIRHNPDGDVLGGPPPDGKSRSKVAFSNNFF
jgi:hypothetical protein